MVDFMDNNTYSDIIISDNGLEVYSLVNVGGVIDQSLNQHRLNSKNTYSFYKRTINDFCSCIFNGISYNELTPQMVSAINGSHAVMYANYLADVRGNANKSIVQKISVIRQMAVWLKRARFDIDPSMMELPAKLKYDNENSSEPFTETEAMEMIKYAKKYDNGEIKSLLIRLAFDTAIRKSALLSLKRENFIIKDGKSYVWVYDKGRKKDTKPIDEELFKHILTLLDTFPKAKLFDMSTRTAERLIIKLKSDLRITGNKTFHSLKKTSINRIARMSGNDLSLMQKHGNHSSATVTMNYAKTEKGTDVYYEMVQSYEGADEKIFKETSNEDLLKAISKASLGTKLELQSLIKKINKGKRRK